MHFKYIFVILVYRNHNDLDECINSIMEKINNFKVIVVDAFYTEECSNNIKKVADKYDSIYLQIENRGYSYGNNYGIEYAKNNFSFDYIIISNPDIIVKHFPDLETYEKPIAIGPMIKNASGKMQNPMYFTKNYFRQKLVYKGLKKDKKSLLFLGLFLNKIDRKIKSLFHIFRNKIKVYQLHGSFVIFNRKLVEMFDKLYDENMFLFAEESYLAKLFFSNRVDSLYFKNILIYHKEDGSMKFRNDINLELKKANIYFYENYLGFGDKNEN